MASTQIAVPGGEQIWDRLDAWWLRLLLLTLALPVLAELLDTRADRFDQVVTVVAAVGLAVWHWQGPVTHPGLVEHPAFVGVYWLVAMALTLVLVQRDHDFLIVLYAQYPLLFGTLRRFAIVVAAVFTAGVTWAVGGFQPGEPGVLLDVAGSVAIAWTVGRVILAIADQSEERQAALVALKAARADLAAAARRAGRLEERERLAREVHDTVAQSFTGIIMQLEAAEQALDGDTMTARAHLDRARGTARMSLTELRRVVHALRPGALDGTKLPEALDTTVRRWSDETGIPAHMTTVGTPTSLPLATESALLRTAQEALTNIARHAGADRATITLTYLAAGVELAVTDDGIGFDIDAVPADRLGLTGMRERLTEVGGQLVVHSTGHAGTVVTAAVPTP